ncbi:MAG: hypothetical protein ACHQPH_24265, partial [Reyranellales bacterium]
MSHKGWHSRGYLPHFDSAETVQFVTFRLVDSLPKGVLETLANRTLRRAGAFWHRDHFDRFIRDEGHLERTIEYVENNPVKAGLVLFASDWP